MTRMLANSTVQKRRRRATMLLLAALPVLFGWGCGGDSPAPSAPAPAPTPAPTPAPEPPSVPTGLQVSASGEDFIEWRWNAVEGADGYDVQFSANEAFTAEDEIIARTAEELSYRREGLAAGTSAYLRVRSTAGTGEDRLESDWSANVTGMTDAPQPTIPPTGTSDDHGNTRDAATPIDLNSSTSGTLETPADLDYFRLEMPSGGGLLDIETTGATDTVGVLYGANSGVLYSDDDSGSGLNFKILTGFLPEGAYFVEVAGFDAGDYALRVELKAGAAGTGQIQPYSLVTPDEEGAAALLEIAAELGEDVSGEHAEILGILRSWGLDLSLRASVGCQGPEVLQAIIAHAESVSDSEDIGDILSAYIDALKDIEPRLRSRECGLFLEGTRIDWDGEERVLEAELAEGDQPIILVWGTPEVGVPVRPAERSRWWVFKVDTTFGETTSGPGGFALSRALANVAPIP